MDAFRKCVIPSCLALLIAPVSGLAGPPQTPNAQEILIDKLLVEIQLALANAQKQLATEGMPHLESVTLDLITEAKREVGGKINLYIVSFGKKWERDRSQEVEITLKPPSPSLPLPVGKGPSVSDQLVSAIVNAARGVQNARKDKDVPLVTTSLKVVLNFVVKGDVSGGVSFEIAPITVDLSGDLTNQAIQKITVVYKNPEDKPRK
jgi:hypothetical protein